MLSPVLTTAFRFAALCGTIATYGVGSYRVCAKPRPKLSQIAVVGFLGGLRSFTFQILAWLLWLVGVVTTWLILHPTGRAVLKKYCDVVSVTSSVASLLASTFMMKSFLVFDARSHAAPAGTGVKRAVVEQARQAANIVVLLGVLLMYMAGSLLWRIEFEPDVDTRIAHLCLAGICMLVACSTTHGLGGFLRHVRGMSQGEATWRFYQPFKGGWLYIVTQCAGWCLFSLSLLGMMWLLHVVLMGIAYCVRCWVMTVGIMMVAAQLLLGSSLLLYSEHKTHPHPIAELKQFFNNMVPIVLLYLPAHICFAKMVLSFTLMPAWLAASLLTAFYIPYYFLTSQGQPSKSGRRKWQALQKWLVDNLEHSLASWFGEIAVVRAFEKQLDPKQKYIFAFHPHGLYPTGAGVVPLLKSFRDAFPGIHPVTLTASIIHYVPIVRDIGQWVGFREVSRGSFVRALKEEGSVMLCPGGQLELTDAYRAWNRVPEVVVRTAHKGFCRLAVEQQAALVPVLAFGEIYHLRNLLNWPALQLFTYKRIGFPIPFLLTGYWFTPFPQRVPTKYVIGPPIHPPVLKNGDNASQEAVMELHDKYFASVKQLFEQYKSSHPMYKNAVLVFK